MSPSLRRRSLIPASCLCVVSIALLSSGPAAAQAPADADMHKAWMDDAANAQEDFRSALTDKDQKAAAEALGTIATLMAKTEEYWTARKVSDAITLAKDARARAAQAADAAKGGRMSAAKEAFDKTNTICSTCHDLHLEKR